MLGRTLAIIICCFWISNLQAQQSFDFTSAQYIHQVPQNLNTASGFQSSATNPYGYVNAAGRNRRPAFPGGGIHHQVTIHGLFLGRSGLDGGAFVFDDNGPQLSFSDLAFDLEAGYRVGLGFLTPDDSGLELMYFENENTFADVQDGPNVMPVFFGGVPAMPVGSYDILYDATLESLEGNYWLRRSAAGRIGIGVRWFSLDEQFDIIQSNATQTGFFCDTNNDMFGLQAMMDRRYTVGNGIRFNAGVKAGGYFNDIDMFADTLNADLTLEDNSFVFNLDYWAGLEFQIDGVTQIRFGYQGLFFTGVAIAPTQSENLSVFTPGVGTVATESVSYNGLYAGLTMTF